MNTSKIHALALLGLLAVACGSSSRGAGAGPSDSGPEASGSQNDDGSGSSSGSVSGGSSGGSSTEGGLTDAASDVGPGGDGSPPAATIQKPGPSPDLFASPFYTCLRNVYVAASGSDSGDGS
jgi:hypothetical protein